MSVIILALNEERSLPDCLRSLTDLACEVFVVDSGSTDATSAIARAAGAQVVEHAFETYGQQRNWALENLPLTTEWILHLDADERLTPELTAEIVATLQSPQADIDGYMLRRRTVFRGRWIRHGGHYPNYQLRLFRRGKGRCEDRRYDQHFIVKGTVGRLRHDFIDTAAGDLSSWSQRHFRWAAAEATEQRAAQTEGERVAARLGQGPIARRRWLRDRLYARASLFVRPAAYFFYRYILRLGFLDGKEGFVFHCLQGFWYRFLVDAMLWEESLRK
ncbi:MAG TPA: glycosyltransferase family 2 protein [Bryobacteraceae bacterium]|jgi:glycosyltransferase involved in cell wall biosynthesis